MGMSDDDVGISGYHGRRPGKLVQAIASMVRRKVELRTMLALETSRIEAAMSRLNSEDVADLLSLLNAENTHIDADLEKIKIDAARIAREDAQAIGVRPMKVEINRATSKVLQNEIERRLLTGHIAPLDLLIQEAVRTAFSR